MKIVCRVASSPLMIDGCEDYTHAYSRYHANQSCAGIDLRNQTDLLYELEGVYAHTTCLRPASHHATDTPHMCSLTRSCGSSSSTRTASLPSSSVCRAVYQLSPMSDCRQMLRIRHVAGDLAMAICADIGRLCMRRCRCRRSTSRRPSAKASLRHIDRSSVG